jgi:hypothetical protein
MEYDDRPPFIRDPGPDERESFNNGLLTGATWDRDYTPGGPFVHRDGYNRDPLWVEFCKRSKRCHDAWHEGFKAGRENEEGCAR